MIVQWGKKRKKNKNNRQSKHYCIGSDYFFDCIVADVDKRLALNKDFREARRKKCNIMLMSSNGTVMNKHYMYHDDTMVNT